MDIFYLTKYVISFKKCEDMYTLIDKLHKLQQSSKSYQYQTIINFKKRSRYEYVIIDLIK